MKRRNGAKNKLFLPDFIAVSVSDIDFAYLKKQGIEVCFFDLDHTILDRGTTMVEKKVAARLKKIGIKLYIATNRRYSDSLVDIAKQIGASGIMYSSKNGLFKPRLNYYKKLIELSGTEPKKIIMVGDRLIQDVFGANRAKIGTILVNKLGSVSMIDRIIILPDLLIPALFNKDYHDVES